MVEDIAVACVIYWVNKTMCLPTNCNFAMLTVKIRLATTWSGTLKRICITLMMAAVVVSMLALGSAQAGQKQRRNTPPLDYELMAFKNSGIWYFLCEAPLIPFGCPPSPRTALPPRPPCGPMPCLPPTGQPMPQMQR